MSLAMVFPGQGSQCVGMLDGFSEWPVVREWIARVDGVMQVVDAVETTSEERDGLGVGVQNPFSQCIAQGPDSWLNHTRNTQPAVFVTAFAAWLAWHAENAPMPSFLAGHSLGEYTALACSEVVDPIKLLDIIRFRARVMEEACPAGAGGMVVVLGLSDPLVQDLCQKISIQFTEQCIEIANYNAPAQVVIAGHKEPLAAAMVEAKIMGAKRAIWLPVSGPFHCSLLKSAGEHLSSLLDTIPFSEPKIPVVNNVDVTLESEPQSIRNTLQRQVFSPVRWTEVVRFLQQKGVTQIVELGPGRVLAGLVARIAPDIQVVSAFDKNSLLGAIEKVCT